MMPKPVAVGPQWFTLEQASKRLGVHPSTLRRWVDRGAIAAFLTPGGHRRFLAADVERFEWERRRTHLPVAFEQQLLDRAVDRARQGVVQQRWLAAYDDTEREVSRQLGRRLVGLVLQFVARADESPELLAEAHAIGRLHARAGQRRGQSLVDLLQAISYFRNTILEVAVVHLHVTGAALGEQEASVRLLRKIEAVLDEVQTGVVECYLTGGLA